MPMQSERGMDFIKKVGVIIGAEFAHVIESETKKLRHELEEARAREEELRADLRELTDAFLHAIQYVERLDEKLSKKIVSPPQFRGRLIKGQAL